MMTLTLMTIAIIIVQITTTTKLIYNENGMLLTANMVVLRKCELRNTIALTAFNSHPQQLTVYR